MQRENFEEMEYFLNKLYYKTYIIFSVIINKMVMVFTKHDYFYMNVFNLSNVLIMHKK
jgi:hypothetical protein